MRIRHTATLLVLAALIGGSTAAHAVERQFDAPGTPTMVRGIVDLVYPPVTIVLTDGTVIEIGAQTELAGEGGIFGILPGDEILVIGERAPAAFAKTIRAGGVRVVAGNGRVAPVGSPVCLAPRSSGGAKAAGPRRGVAKSGGETQIEGTVVSVGEDSFILRTVDDDDFSVLVDDETELEGLDSLDELEAGNDVKARGELDGTTLTATRVELLQDDDGGGGGDGDDDGVDFESTGLLTELLPPDRFALSDQRVYRVDGMTDFDDPIVSYSGLAVGQYLEVKAVYEGGASYRAVKVEYEGDAGGGQGYVEVAGVVAAVAATDVALSDGVVVLFTPSTVFNGDADRWQEIEPGWRIEVLALRNAVGDLLALEVRAENEVPPTTVGQDFVPHEAILVLASGADAAAIAARHGAEVAGEIATMGVLFEWQREIDDKLLAELAADPEVAAVEPNFLFRDPESVRRRFVVVDRSPTAEEYTGQAAAVRHGVANALGIANGAGTVVAVMDTGVDHCHPLLKGHLAGGGLDLVDGDFSPWETRDGLDEDGDGEIDEAAGHGTFVSSLVALGAPGAKILPYRVLDDDGGGTAFNLALALADAIARGVDVINLSLTYHERSIVVDLLLEEAAAKGIVVVAAAGNDGASKLPFPATDSHVLAVTALSADGARLANFANRGAKVITAATGEEVYGGLDQGAYGISSGTSLAAPFAAAGAALVKSLDPGVSADIVRRLLEQSGVAVTDGAWSGRSLDLGLALTTIQ